jgi:hypothetical protein
MLAPSHLADESIHSMAAALMKLDGLTPYSRRELLSVFCSVSFMALNGGGSVLHERELGGDQSRRRVPAQRTPLPARRIALALLIFTRNCSHYRVVVAVVDGAFLQAQR